MNISESYCSISLGVWLKSEKKQHEPSSLEADKHFLTNIVDVCVRCVWKTEYVLPLGDISADAVR